MSALNTYFQVDDLESTLAKAMVPGATVLAPKTAIPGMGFWAMFADPDGIPIGLLQPECGALVVDLEAVSAPAAAAADLA